MSPPILGIGSLLISTTGRAKVIHGTRVSFPLPSRPEHPLDPTRATLHPKGDDGIDTHRTARRNVTGDDRHERE